MVILPIGKWRRRAEILIVRRLLERHPDEALIPPGYHLHKNPKFKKRERLSAGFIKEEINQPELSDLI